MKKFFLIVLSVLPFCLSAQLNTSLLGQVDYQQLHNTDLNDVWGYVDETGIEYALVGARKGTSVVSLADPSNPTEVRWIPGMESIWRDLKTFGDYAYVTTEADQGLLIVDLSPLPASTVLPTNLYTGPPGFNWDSAHNLYIDENGYCYIFGADRGNGGVIILDVFTDPMNPIEVGTFDNWYVHDGFVRNDTMYLAHINDGFLTVVDVSDKSNPVLLGQAVTSKSFTHNIWPSDNGQFVYTTDERSGAFVDAYDISDPANIVRVDKIQSSPGMGVIPHNTHVLGNFLVTSYYSDGVVIHDATHPHNLVEVGYYDTYATQTQSYDGCWGAYPFLPSGLLLATDISNGLFVLGATYQQAAYLEGNVTDITTSAPIPGVSVTILGNTAQNQTNTSGDYATGIATGGLVDVEFFKIGYYRDTLQVTLTNGIISNLDAQLTPIPPYSLRINVVESGTLLPIQGADVRCNGTYLSHTGSTNALGYEDLTMYYEEDYEIVAGKWSYITNCITQFVDQNTVSVTIELTKGYYDDFAFDFGWVTGGTATTGNWERAIPILTASNANPGWDVGSDCDEYAYVTGNFNTTDFNIDDVDEGNVVLYSPIMDLSAQPDAYVNYDFWFYSFYGNPIPDTVFFRLSNGSATVTIDQFFGPYELFSFWNHRSIKVSDFLPITSTMQIIVETSDYEPTWNITEAAFDKFYITEYSTSEVAQIEEKEAWSFSPNPAQESIEFKGLTSLSEVSVYAVSGQSIGSLNWLSDAVLDVSSFQPGVYLIYVDGNIKRLIKY